MTISIKPTASGSTIEQDGSTILTVDGSGNITPSNNLYPKVPAFSAYKNSGNQSVTTSSFTKVTFDTELFDTNNNFASSTFTPTVAGYYQINAGISIVGSGTLSRAILVAYKNGSGHYTLQDLAISDIKYRYSGSCLIYCNGSTDYIDIYVFLIGTSPILESGVSNTGYNVWFSGSLVSV